MSLTLTFFTGLRRRKDPDKRRFIFGHLPTGWFAYGNWLPGQFHDLTAERNEIPQKLRSPFSA